MHCVLCGNPLQNGNQAGLVCQLCKLARTTRRRHDEQALVIRYCFRCGKPYHPRDSSIQHPLCGAEQAASNLALELRQHAHEKND